MKKIVSVFLLIVAFLFCVGCSQTDGNQKSGSTQQELNLSVQVRQKPINQCTNQSAVQYAKALYREHYYLFSESTPKMIDQLYSAEFKEAIKNHAECVGDNGSCNLHFDPWLDAQDGYVDGKVDFSVRKRNSDTVWVDLNYQFRVHSTLPARPQTVSLLLQRADTSLCWKMDDMLLPNGASMKAMMASDYEHFYYYKKTQLSWNLLSSDMESSKIAVIRDKQIIGEYKLNCDVSESLSPEQQQLDEEVNRVGLVVTPSKPQGFLITSCRFGAHSKQLSVYDLESKSPYAVWEKTGSYFGEWSVNQNYDLVLSYDEPCNKLNCSAPFVRKDVIWGADLKKIR